MEETRPNKTGANRRANGTFGPGNVANPAGRPKGKTLKEFAREYLMSLSDDEKLKFLKQLPAEITWKMAEGNPHQTTEAEVSGGKKPIELIIHDLSSGS